MASRFLRAFRAAALGVGLWGAPPAAALDCTALRFVSLPNAVITSTAEFPAGGFSPKAGFVFWGLPAFCRIQGETRPTSDSLIKFDLWLPLGGAYNGKYLQVGNGGFSGVFDYAALAEGIRRGYATAATDDGSQTEGTAAFAHGHPEKIRDYGWRSLKETADKSKALIAAFAGALPTRSYFAGCSNGGRQGLMLAQRFPNEFDGIIAGAPANYYTHQFAGFAWNFQSVFPDPGPPLEPVIKWYRLPVLANAVRAQCAGNDGGLAIDKFLNDPTQCHIDWAKIVCQPGQDPATCLAPQEIAAVQKVYAGPSNPLNGAPIYPGYAPGSEDEVWTWPAWITGFAPHNPRFLLGLQTLGAIGFFANFVFSPTGFNLYNINVAADVITADGKVGADLNAIDPNLRAFRNRGGKLIQYHGWADAAVSPYNSISYYEAVRAELGRRRIHRGKRVRYVGDPISYSALREFYRLFMAPGVGHCAGGPGPNAFGNAAVNGTSIDADHDLLKALEHWVENGVAPDRIIATKFVDDNAAHGIAAQRPLCPYPRQATYNGATDPSQAGSFQCSLRFRNRPLPRP